MQSTSDVAVMFVMSAFLQLFAHTNMTSSDFKQLQSLSVTCF